MKYYTGVFAYEHGHLLFQWIGNAKIAIHFYNRKIKQISSYNPLAWSGKIHIDRAQNSYPTKCYFWQNQSFVG